jgi:Cytochrome c554 and c-prime
MDGNLNNRNSPTNPKLFFSRILPAALLLFSGLALGIIIFRTSQPALAQTAAPAAAAESPNSSAAPARPLLDPVLFADWPPPQAALVITGLLDGYIEPCGCSGKENMQGGLSRRDMLLKQLAQRKWPTVAIDLGDQVRRFGQQQVIKFQATADALKTMDYRAIGLGPNDLRLAATELYASIASVGNAATPFVSANATIAFDPKAIPRQQVIAAGGLKIGITSVLGDKERARVSNQDIQLQPADEALAAVLPQLQAAKCDLLVLLAEANKDESIALAKKFPQFQIVVTAGGAEVPPKEATVIEGTQTKLIELGAKGMYAIVLGLYGGNGADSIRYQRVPLDVRFGDSPRMKRALASYQDSLKQSGFEGLGIKPQTSPDGRTFVGSQACSECHTKAFAIWKKTPHATALETLVKLDPPRQYDPECLSCHVTGWEPQKNFPLTGGFLSLEKTPELAGNGCENCHGPGSRHVAAEREEVKVSEADRTSFRNEMHLSLKTEADRQHVIDICLKCHDIDNSIQFKGGDAFDEYWPKVAHHGKD